MVIINAWKLYKLKKDSNILFVNLKAAVAVALLEVINARKKRKAFSGSNTSPQVLKSKKSE